MVFATDLDRTLIYSNKFVNKENKKYISGFPDGVGFSFLTNKAIEYLTNIKEKIDVVPCTTRSREQFNRIPLFKDCKYSICSNGATIFHNGKVDSQWNMVMRKNMDFCMNDMLLFHDKLKQQSFLTREIQLVDNFFLFTKVDTSTNCIDFLEANLDKKNFYYAISGQKLYIFPTFISKEHALGYVLDRLNDNNLISAGDSEMDIGILNMATVKAFIIQHNKEQINIDSKIDTQIFHNCGIMSGEYVLKQINNILEKGGIQQ